MNDYLKSLYDNEVTEELENAICELTMNYNCTIEDVIKLVKHIGENGNMND